TPLERWWWAYAQRAYPMAEVPPGARMRAWHEIEGSERQQPPSGAARLAPTPLWMSIGPAPILNTRFGMVSGRASALAVDPNPDPIQPNHWLLGAASGGIWETRDAGATWEPRTDEQPSPSIGAIAFSESNPSIVYAGTGEPHFSGDSYAGDGLLVSND